MAEDWKTDVKKLTEAVDRLGKDLQLLRKDVRRLGERIVPGKWEDSPSELFEGGRGPRTFAAMFDELRGFRNLVRWISGYVGQMSARVDTVEHDVVARDEMKEWLIEAKPPQSKDRG